MVDSCPLLMSNITVPEQGFGYYNATYQGSYLPTIDGVYNVTIFARDAAPEYNVNSTPAENFTSWGNVSMMLLGSPDVITAFNITQSSGYTFILTTNVTNLGPAHAYNVNLTHTEDPVGSLTYNETDKTCGTMDNYSMCNWTYEITVPAATIPSAITSYIWVTWRNADNTVESVSNATYITVSSNPVISISPSNLNKTVVHNNNTLIGYMNTRSEGNDEVSDVNIYHVGGNLDVSCPECVLTSSRPNMAVFSQERTSRRPSTWTCL